MLCLGYDFPDDSGSFFFSTGVDSFGISSYGVLGGLFEEIRASLKLYSEKDATWSAFFTTTANGVPTGTLSSLCFIWARYPLSWTSNPTVALSVYI